MNVERFVVAVDNPAHLVVLNAASVYEALLFSIGPVPVIR